MLQSIARTCRRVISEPLAIFVLISLLLFVLYDRVADPTGAGRGEVHVTSGHIHQLVGNFEKVWSRSPTPEEVEALIEGYVRDEIMFRAAVAMGLDQEDSEVRRHLLSKLERFSSNMLADIPVEDEMLEAFMHDNLDKYQQSENFSFEQLYFNSDAEAKARSVLAQLQDDQNPLSEAAPIERARLTDPSMLSQYCDTCTPTQIAWGYGRDFSEQLPQLNPGQWHGPVVTDMGLHLIKIHQHELASIPDLETIRRDLERDYRFEHRSRMMDDLVQHRINQFRIQVDEYTWTQEITDTPDPVSTDVSMRVEK